MYIRLYFASLARSSNQQLDFFSSFQQYTAEEKEDQEVHAMALLPAQTISPRWKCTYHNGAWFRVAQYDGTAWLIGTTWIPTLWLWYKGRRVAQYDGTAWLIGTTWIPSLWLWYKGRRVASRDDSAVPTVNSVVDRLHRRE